MTATAVTALPWSGRGGVIDPAARPCYHPPPMKRLFITAAVSMIAGLILGILVGRRMPPTREQVANYLANLSLGEASDFFKRLNTQFGFQAFPQQFFPTPPSTSEPSK
jgi:hypothetical protein